MNESIVITLAAAEATILGEIADKRFKRKSVAKTYSLAMRTHQLGHEVIDWKKVNEAIIARWSFSGLNWIKEQAHSGKCFA